MSGRRSRGAPTSAGRPAVTGSDEAKNPFQVPADQEIFAMRDRDKQRDAEHRALVQTQKIYEKGVKRCGVRTRELLLDTQLDVEFLEHMEKTQAPPAASIPKDYTEKMFAREGLHDFIANKREMFFLQYALAVKTNEIEKLEKSAQDEELALLEEEKALENDTAKFDAYLKENDKNCVEAIRKADVETKLKLEKIHEAKRASNLVAVSKAEIMKCQDHLNDLIRYRDFLREIAPRDSGIDTAPVNDIETLMKNFQRPDQLLRIFSDLEENNLSLIQSCQETEETLEDLKRKIAETELLMNGESDGLQRQIVAVKQAIAKEEEKAAQLEQKTKLVTNVLGSSAGAAKESQDALLTRLHSRVTEAYKKCIGSGSEPSQLSTLQMLAEIEGKLESLLESLEAMPVAIVEQAEKAKEKERRQRQREQKVEMQRQQQEERIRKAMERAQAPVKKQSGKPIMFRSVLPKIKHNEAKKIAAESGDVLNSYFMDA